MKVSTPQDIVRECNSALEILSDGMPSSDLRAHVLALLCMKHADCLPPHQQSLNALALNLNNALRTLERTNPLLNELTSQLTFEHSFERQPIEPTLLRAAMSGMHSLNIGDRDLLARATEQFVFANATAGESSFVNPLLVRLMSFGGGLTVLDCNCGSGLRTAHAQRAATDTTSSFQRTRKLRISAEESSAAQRCLTRLVAVLCDLQLDVRPAGTAFSGGPGALRTYDRLFVECSDERPDVEAVLRRMADHSVCALILSDSASQQMRKSDMAVLLERDVLDSIVTIHSSVRATWHIMILRGRKAVERRHRVVFYDHTDPFDGPGLDSLSVETITEAVEQFKTLEDRCRVIHRSDILSANRIMPSLLAPVPLMPYQRDSFPGALSASQFVDLDSRLISRGIDVHSFFIKSTRNDHYRPAFNDHSLLRVAVASAPSLKNSEVRTQYAFATWWSSTAPLLLIDDADIEAVQTSFEHHLSVENILSPRQCRALFREWWWNIDDDRTILTRFTALTLVHAWIDQMLHDATVKGPRFWFELDTMRRSLLEYMCPDLVRKLNASDAAIAGINRSQSTLSISPTQAMADMMMRRRTKRVLDEARQSHIEFDIARERIAELRDFVQRQKDRMKELHAAAKAHRTSVERVELFDDTRDMQDELAGILTRMVPAQSELMMLEKSIAPFDNLERMKEREHSAVDEFVRQLIPSLLDIRNALSPQLATSLALLHFREQLSRLVEQAIIRNRESVIVDLESVWRRMEQGASFAPSVHINDVAVHTPRSETVGTNPTS